MIETHAGGRIRTAIDQISSPRTVCGGDQRGDNRVARSQPGRDEAIALAREINPLKVIAKNVERVRRVVHRTLAKDADPPPEIVRHRLARQDELRADLYPPGCFHLQMLIQPPFSHSTSGFEVLS